MLVIGVKSRSPVGSGEQVDFRGQHVQRAGQVGAASSMPVPSTIAPSSRVTGPLGACEVAAPTTTMK